MAILRKKLKENFTVISNDIFKDKELSMKSRGLLCTMLSLPDKWEFSEKGLESLFPDGQCAIRSAIKELTELGYLKRERIRDGGKFNGWEWTIYDHRVIENEEPKESNLNLPNLENPNLVDMHQLNTKELKTNESRTKEEKKLTNRGTQNSFENQITKSDEYELKSATDYDVEKIVFKLMTKMAVKECIDFETQKKFSKEPIDRIINNTSATFYDVISASIKLLNERPKLKDKTPSYFLRDCEKDICQIIVSTKNGTGWSKW